MKQLICFFCFLIQLTVCSQDIQIKKLDIKNGLPDNSVRSVIQDHHGYLWFGTLNGLSRYDGKNFKNYLSIPGDTTCLTNTRMVNIAEDKKGFIWTWADNLSMQRVNVITDEVININRQILKEKIDINDFKIVSNGDIWVWGDKGFARIKYLGNNVDLKAEIFNKENGFKNKIRFLFEDKFKNIWVGTKAGLVKVNASNGYKSPQTYFKDTDFISFYTFKDESWFGTKSRGVVKYSNQSNIFNWIEKLNKEINSRPIVRISKPNSNELLLGSDGVVFQFNIVKNTATAVYDDKFNGFHSFFNDSFNNTWLLARNTRGIFKYSSLTKKIEFYNLKGNERAFLGESDNLRILEDSNKNLWIGVRGGGLFLYDRAKNYFINYKSNDDKVGSLSSDIVLSLFEDASKNLWVSTMYGGVNKINLAKEKFIWHQPVIKPGNIYENEVRSSAEDKKGNLWVGTKGGKIFGYQNYKLKYTFPDDLSAAIKDKLRNINVYSLFVDHADNLWVGTKGKGLFVLKNISSTPPSKLEIVFIDVKEVPALNNVYSIKQDKSNNYWIGSHGNGLAVLSNPFTNIKIISFEQGKLPNQLISKYVRCLYFDHDGNLWIGTSFGLNLLPANQLNLAGKKFISIEHVGKEISSLSFNDVDHIFQASDKNIYVSTLGGGINVLSYKNLKDKNFVWKILSVSDGLSTNKVFGIQEDSEKNIWISTSLGINKYYPKTGKFENFFIEKEYGLNYFSEGCASKLSNGNLFFGHNKGFLTFNPKSITKDKTNYPIVLSKIFINGNEELPRKSSIINKSIEYEEGIELSYLQNTIRLDFSVLDFKNPEKIQFSYKLDNFDENWSVPLTSNTAIYQNLPPGEYTFMLKATNSDDVELDKILKFKINIKPPFFKSCLGYFIIFLFLGSIFFGFLHLYKKQISAKQEVLFTDRLNEKKLMYYTNISHEFKTPLTLILCHLQDILDDVKVAKETKLIAKQIQKSASYLSNLIEQILDFRKIKEEKMKLSLAKVDIVEFIKNIHSQFVPLANKEKIDLRFSAVEKEILGYLDAGIMKKVLYNLLSNAIKFTPVEKSIEISLELTKKGDSIKIKIIDEGVGISIEDQKTLFERFGKSENSSGLGLSYVKELVNFHNGSIEVESALDTGTCFTITIPITQNEYSEADFNISEIQVEESNFSESVSENLLDNEVKNTSKKPRYSILIIDDNDEMRDYLFNKFKPFFNVISAINGQEGVAMAVKELPDVIVCDLMMPLLDGIGTVQALKENFNTCHIPIILLTANSSENKKMEGIGSGADDYITKPFNFSYLKLRIDALITQRNLIIQTLSKNPELSLDILTNTDEDKLFLEKVMQLVEKSIGESYFNVDFIILNMGISRTNFYKKIKGITGETPHEFINTIQMKKAALLLKSTNYTIGEISVICGFNDPVYFSRIFKKYFGEGPKSYQVGNKE
ncbi:hybrid sensor histidine kinase/response regulator transcription factor [Flavobacterium sp. WC2509]|uniref:hybrid sensor histidine kinase/response regulator transcription factor n=1 Tax=Flavobacterium sp. WC2509 TaxID=3461406 RepID=UPI004044FFAA